MTSAIFRLKLQHWFHQVIPRKACPLQRSMTTYRCGSVHTAMQLLTVDQPVVLFCPKYRLGHPKIVHFHYPTQKVGSKYPKHSLLSLEHRSTGFDKTGLGTLQEVNHWSVVIPLLQAYRILCSKFAFTDMSCLTGLVGSSKSVRFIVNSGETENTAVAEYDSVARKSSGNRVFRLKGVRYSGTYFWIHWSYKHAF